MLHIIGIAALFSVLGLVIVVLLVVKKCAAKYLDGDFFSSRTEEEETEYSIIEFSDEELNIRKPSEKVSEGAPNKADVIEEENHKGKEDFFFTEGRGPMDEIEEDVETVDAIAEGRVVTDLDEQHSDGIIQESITHSQSFYDVPQTSTSFAKMSLSLEFNKTTRIITGCVHTIQGLVFGDSKTSDYVSVHISIRPQCKNKTKTRWSILEKDAFSNEVALEFFIGPIVVERIHPTSKLFFRLYCKEKSCVSHAKCFGECVIPFHHIIESEGAMEVEQQILPKGFSEM